MPGDAAYLLREHAPVVRRVRRALTAHVRDAHLAVPLDLYESVFEVHVVSPEGGHPPQLVLERVRGVPAVQEHLLQGNQVSSQIERLQKPFANQRFRHRNRQVRRKRRAEISLDQREASLREVEDVFPRHVQGALAVHGRRETRASVRLPRLRVARKHPRRVRHRGRHRGARTPHQHTPRDSRSDDATRIFRRFFTSGGGACRRSSWSSHFKISSDARERDDRHRDCEWAKKSLPPPRFLLRFLSSITPSSFPSAARRRRRSPGSACSAPPARAPPASWRPACCAGSPPP